MALFLYSIELFEFKLDVMFDKNSRFINDSDKNPGGWTGIGMALRVNL